jgi:hypothetical protein
MFKSFKEGMCFSYARLGGTNQVILFSLKLNHFRTFN